MIVLSRVAGLAGLSCSFELDFPRVLWFSSSHFSRIPSFYSSICYIFQVIEIANLDGLSKSKAYSFFNEVIYPFAMKVYQETHCGSCPVPESGESLIVHLLVQCISQYQIPLEQVNNFYSYFIFLYNHD